MTTQKSGFNLDVLWRLPLLKAAQIAFAVMGVGLLLVALLYTPEGVISAHFIILSGILILAFLVKMPTGSIAQRVRFELASLICAVALFVGGGIVNLIAHQLHGLLLLQEPLIPTSYNYIDNILPMFVLLSVPSYFAVRIFGRPYSVWREMRHRRLVWQITHAQLRLVILTMLVLYVMALLMIASQVRNASVEETVVNGLTLLITIAGFFGIITGILLFIVIIPAAVIAYLTATRLTQRLEKLADMTQTIHDTHYTQRIEIEGSDEIARLQSDFNQMLDRIAASRAALEEERDTVRKLLHTRQRLFADVSHELRTPIAILRGYLDNLDVNENQQTDLAIVQREALRLQHLVDSVFDFAREDVNQLPYEIRAVEISAVLERTTRILHKQAWQSRKVSVILDYAPQIPLVLVDEERVEQVLYNLLRNALKHTHPGGLIRIEATTAPRWVEIAVQDTGTGIPPDELDQIWQRFYRGQLTPKQDRDGAGIGLALVKEMIETMGGNVSVTSALGKGSCFRFTLPRAG